MSIVYKEAPLIPPPPPSFFFFAQKVGDYQENVYLHDSLRMCNRLGLEGGVHGGEEHCVIGGVLSGRWAVLAVSR